MKAASDHLFALIEEAKEFWWDGHPDGEFAPLACEIGEWCVQNEAVLREALDA